MQLPSNEDVRLWYRNHVNSGLLGLLGFMGLDVTEVRAEGWLVQTSDQREFIDCLGGYGSLNFGHRHPRIVAAVKEQLDSMALSAKILLNAPQAQLAKRLAELTPGELQFSFFSNSGTEAVEAALKFARFHTGRPGIISARHGFHGKTLGSLSSTHRDQYQAPFKPLMPGFEQVAFNNLDELEAALNDATAAVLLEPVQGEGGIILPDSEYLPQVRELTKAKGALLILDEVQTGMGRSGWNFAAEQSGVCPDIMVLAKSLGGGVMPVGATLGTAEVWAALEENPTLHTSTFGGNELACAAALAACEVLVEENLAEQARRNGEIFLHELKAVAAKYPALVREVRGQGLMLGIEMMSKDISELFIANTINRNVLIAFALNQPGVIRLEPPLAIPAEVLGEVTRRLDQALADTMNILEQYGLLLDEEEPDG